MFSLEFRSYVNHLLQHFFSGYNTAKQPLVNSGKAVCNLLYRACWQVVVVSGIIETFLCLTKHMLKTSHSPIPDSNFG